MNNYSNYLNNSKLRFQHTRSRTRSLVGEKAKRPSQGNSDPNRRFGDGDLQLKYKMLNTGYQAMHAEEVPMQFHRGETFSLHHDYFLIFLPNAGRVSGVVLRVYRENQEENASVLRAEGLR